MKTIVATLWLALCSATSAHEGHGMPGISHWHASDTWGFIAVAAALGAALWWSRRK